MTTEETEDTAETRPAAAWIARHPGPWFALAWAPLLLAAPVAGGLADRQLGRLGYLALLGVAYAGTVWLAARVGERRRWPELLLLLLVVLVTVYLVVWRTDREFLFPLLAIAMATAVRPQWALGLVGSLAVSGAVTAGFEDRSVDTALGLAFATFFAGAATFLVRYQAGLVDELTRTRARLARLAVNEERSRFSRDLHDLLGHSLSVMVVKAQAVRRLVHRDQAAAADHARDIEDIGRRALTAVREAVTGYRTVRLSEELRNARTALAAANIRLEVTPANGDLPAEADSLLGWVVREGTTNVLRHAKASTCRIAVHRGAGAVEVEIIDDGRGGPVGAGSGLRGLRERVDELGGTLDATATSSGFRLAVAVPTHAAEGGRQ